VERWHSPRVCATGYLQQEGDATVSKPVLYSIESYGCHVKLADCMRHEPYNVFVLLEPPNMTNILQPLDVDVNRSYREYYRGNYHEYIVKAMKEPLLQTKARNPKYLATIWYK
jgi:hypothetical protein